MLLLLTLSAQLLSGRVVSAETREPLGLTIVTVRPHGGKQFTDAAGGFAFPTVGVGTYVLSVRQIGYTPLDTQIVVPTGGLRLMLVLRHLAVELPAITITGHTRCTHPGPPDRQATPALAAVFDQFLESARRLELLADSFPFRFLVERSLRDVRTSGDSLPLAIDTLDLESRETRRPYRPGQIVTEGYGPYRGRIVSLPSLHEFGDSAFLSNHCFRLAGRDTIAGETLVRIDFEPHEGLRHSDVAGSAFLDSSTYALRYTETELTRPERAAIRGLRDLRARIRFRDIATGVVLPDHVRAVTRYRAGGVRSRVEVQTLLGIHYRRALPPSP